MKKEVIEKDICTKKIMEPNKNVSIKKEIKKEEDFCVNEVSEQKSKELEKTLEEYESNQSEVGNI